MSIPTLNQAYAFLNPLRGRSSAFLVSSRSGNLAVARFVLGCLARLRTRVVIVDTGCFYGINASVLERGLPRDFLQHTIVVTPTNDGTPPHIIAELMTNTEARAIIIDDLNSLNTLIAEGEKSGVHELYTVVRMLSYIVRHNGMWVLMTAYGSQRQGITSKRTLTAAADLQIKVGLESKHVTFDCVKDSVWHGKRFDANTDLFLGQNIDANIDCGRY